MSDTITPEEYLHEDLFAFVPDEIARNIASVCGKLGVKRCTRSELSDIYRDEHGLPVLKRRTPGGNDDE